MRNRPYQVLKCSRREQLAARRTSQMWLQMCQRAYFANVSRQTAESHDKHAKNLSLTVERCTPPTLCCTFKIRQARCFDQVTYKQEAFCAWLAFQCALPRERN